jgi:hypothetical protein
MNLSFIFYLIAEKSAYYHVLRGNFLDANGPTKQGVCEHCSSAQLTKGRSLRVNLADSI